jgi:hypothetical protein
MSNLDDLIFGNPEQPRRPLETTGQELISRLSDLMPGKRDKLATGICNVTDFDHVRRGGTTPKARTYQHICQRVGEKIAHIEAGGDPEEFRINKRGTRKGKPAPIPVEQAAHIVYDVLYNDLQELSAKAALEGREFNRDGNPLIKALNGLGTLFPDVRSKKQ